MKFIISKQVTFTGIGVLALLIAAGTAMAIHPNASNGGSTHGASTRMEAAKQPGASTGNTAADDSAASGSNSSGSQTAGTGNSTSSTPAVTAACKLLTPNIAQQILGSDAKASSADSTSVPQATDTTLDACAYSSTASGANGTLQLIIRTPKSSLGASENATAFGSEKPAGATSVKGYGQTAYWDSGKHRLNVLGSNNWYSITRTTNGQPSSSADTQAIAKLLASGF
jgi:hypothetical protein